MKKVAILQSNYIPWKGYFDLIAAVDEFILYDDMQFTKNDWRNRNIIKTPKGTEWLSIPVGQSIRRRIRDVGLPSSSWQRNHWKTLEANYRRAGCFHEVAQLLEPLYLQRQFTGLSEINRVLIEVVCNFLGVTTKISNSWDYSLDDGKTARLVSLCMQAGGTAYVSGPAAMGYLEESLFAERGIGLEWFSYDGYPKYPQLWGDFVHGVSILDLLFNCGKESSHYMKFGRL